MTVHDFKLFIDDSKVQTRIAGDLLDKLTSSKKLEKEIANLYEHLNPQGEQLPI